MSVNLKCCVFGSGCKKPEKCKNYEHPNVCGFHLAGKCTFKGKVCRNGTHPELSDTDKPFIKTFELDSKTYSVKLFEPKSSEEKKEAPKAPLKKHHHQQRPQKSVNRDDVNLALGKAIGNGDFKPLAKLDKQLSSKKAFLEKELANINELLSMVKTATDKYTEYANLLKDATSTTDEDVEDDVQETEQQ